MPANFDTDLFKPTRIVPKLLVSNLSKNTCFTENCFCKQSKANCSANPKQISKTILSKTLNSFKNVSLNFKNHIYCSPSKNDHLNLSTLNISQSYNMNTFVRFTPKLTLNNSARNKIYSHKTDSATLCSYDYKRPCIPFDHPKMS
ncbi:hypothetical protein BB561_004753 [Smittium simulii]|uniref:Uncharacterized protein n=1 Tax=Smittium simulii TaxID=133385 RepID=A0A2T9YEH3_9FUNG|nr:hypothetical protein BB561_004753 [Smittium simulii]